MNVPIVATDFGEGRLNRQRARAVGEGARARDRLMRQFGSALVLALVLCGLTGGVRVSVARAASEPYVSLNPSRVDFGRHPLDTRAKVLGVTVTNVTGGGLYMPGYEISQAPWDALANIFGNQPGDCPVQGVLKPGQTCTINVAFSPKSIGTVYHATLKVRVDPTPSEWFTERTYEVPLTGVGGAAEIAFTPPAFHLDNAVPGQGVALDLEVSNTTAAPLTIVRLHSPNDPYFITRRGTCGEQGMPYVLAAGQTCRPDVRFLPPIGGDEERIEYRGHIHVELESGVEYIWRPSATTVGRPEITLDGPASIDFGEVLVGRREPDPGTHMVWVRNTGTRKATFSIKLVNPGNWFDTSSGGFGWLSGNTAEEDPWRCRRGGELEAGASCALDFFMEPNNVNNDPNDDTVGPSTRWLEVHHNGPNSPRKVTLSGVGVKDEQPPISGASRTGTLGSNGWYRSDVNVTLSATDGPAGTNWGVRWITYRADGAQPIPTTEMWDDMEWLTFGAEGITDLTFFAGDGGGNVEPAKSVAIKVDKAPPEVSASVVGDGPGPLTGWYGDEVTITLTGSDGLSGVRSLSFGSTGAQTTTTRTVAGNEASITIDAEGVTTIAYTATDFAGNQSSEGTFVVRVDRTGPSVACESPDDQWHAVNVSVACTAEDLHSGLRDPADRSFTLATVVDPGEETATAWTGQRTVVNGAGLFTVAGPIGNLKVDRKAPLTGAAVSGPRSVAAGDWYTGDAIVSLAAVDRGSGIASLTYGSAGAQTNETVTVPQATASLPITAEGVTTVTWFATDNVGNAEEAGTLTVKVDKTAPTTAYRLSTPPNATGWHNANVTIGLSAADLAGGSGAASVSFRASGAQTIDTTTVTGDAGSVVISAEGATTISYWATDVAGNAEIPKTLVLRLDRTAPTITLALDPGGGEYRLGQVITATYSCADAGSGVTGCDGAMTTGGTAGASVPSGGRAETASVGEKSFSVTASDTAGNVSVQSITYAVTYRVCPLFDQTRAHRLGSTVPIKVALCDDAGRNLSSPSATLMATGLTKQDSTASGSLVEDAGNANADSSFRYDPALRGYVYNLSTKGLSEGTWRLAFAVAGDPLEHGLNFDVR